MSHAQLKKVWFNREGKGVYKWFRQFDEVYNRERGCVFSNVT